MASNPPASPSPDGPCRLVFVQVNPPPPPDGPTEDPSDAAEPASDGLVRALPDVLASKIAAGEVVQRPASVLKELVENALDAGAQTVAVCLKKAGAELVQVTDDGGGMGPADAVAAFGRHATSKLRRFEDLERLATLGFRGEALASIAAVARVELRTKRAQDETGTLVRVEGGRTVERRPCAVGDGTTIAVRDLFYNVPARRAFLRTPATEFKHLVETFQTLALSNPEAGFSLEHDGAEVYRLPSAPPGTPFEDALRLRLAALFGEPSVEGELVAVGETTSYLSLRGFVGRPEAARRGRQDGFFFVNGRTVRSRPLDHAVASAFGALLPEGRHPFFALFLSVDARHVDVNVHPTKTEVKFDDERGVYGFIRAVVKRGLGAADFALAWDGPATGGAEAGETGSPFASSFAPTPSAAGAEPPTRGWAFAPEPEERGDGHADAPPGRDDPYVFTPLHAPRPAGPFDAGGGFEAVGPDAPQPAGAPPPAPLPSRAEADAPLLDAEAESLRGDRALWTLHGRYVLTPIRSGLLVLDQQAAHERILYERALAAMEGGLGASQQLLFPHALDLGPADAALVRELAADLRSLGFDLDLRAKAVVVRGVPTDVRVGAERSILEEVLAQYKANRDQFALAGRESLARALARRSAIRPGQALKPAEARALIDQLFACQMPYADPAGRPTMVKVTLDELERRFSRAAR